MVAGDLDGLLGVMDLDDVADIETLLIILFNRPISVQPLDWVDDDEGSLEVTVWAGDTGHVAGRAFPMTGVDLVRAGRLLPAEPSLTSIDIALPRDDLLIERFRQGIAAQGLFVASRHLLVGHGQA